MALHTIVQCISRKYTHEFLMNFFLALCLVLTCHQERGTIHSGETPLMIASRGGHVDIVRLLIEAKAQVNIQKEVWLLLPPQNTTSSYKCKNIVEGVGKHAAFCVFNTICLTQDGATPLWIASQEGHSDTVNTLIRNGANINQPRNVGRGLTYGILILYVHHLFLSHRLVQHLCT